MTTLDYWTDQAKRFLKVELKRAGVTYAGLAEKLSLIGLSETEASITMKINRGRFSVPFLFATLKVIGVELQTRPFDAVTMTVQRPEPVAPKPRRLSGSRKSGRPHTPKTFPSQDAS